MKKFTVLLAEINERSNVIAMHMEGLNPKHAAVLAATELHDEQYTGWTDLEVSECGEDFDFKNYVVVSVYEGHIENLYNEVG